MISPGRREMAVCALAVLFCAGCQPTRVYLRDRGEDLVEVVRLNVAYGPGLGATVYATSALKLGVTGEHSRHVGLDGHGFGAWGQDRFDWHLVLGGFEYGHRDSPIRGSVRMNPGSGGGYWRSPLLGGRYTRSETEHVCGASELGGRASLLLVGVEAGVRFWELLDFLCGLFGLDPQRDDTAARQPSAADSPPEATQTHTTE
ncbi:MAG: hypothetical protein FJ279_06970 [Planctomycetes bacterium]|nr:hypothetical protein [Planctomycetota bacterium]MBM4078387.1 hypothetical protein [Planctomycetota bacterium]